VVEKKEPRRLERQADMSLAEMLSDLPTHCAVGTKRNAKGHTTSWIGYNRLPQPGHTKPSGQRRLNKKAAQLSSSENDFWNSASDRALAISVRPRDRANPIAQILHVGEPESTGQASRKLLIALWRLVREGVVPDGIILRPAQ
jgi:hypothetical protein